jgi:endo-alpha-1,4-polygalactosaminidase (GH114 family)
LNWPVGPPVYKPMKALLSTEARVTRLIRITAIIVGIAAALPGCAGASEETTAGAGWQPAPSTAAWQWQLQGKLDLAVTASVYDIDGFETPTATVQALHRQGRKAICYLDVGSWENFRPDAGRFPKSVLGNRYEGFPNERWLDISRFHSFAAALKARIAICARKGFDAVEPDNVTGWEPENKTGFQITRADQLRFNRWVARQVHSRGMAVALKNDGRQVKQLIGQYDFAIVEQCFQYDECGYYRPFVEQGKAVFEAEYELEPAQFCPAAIELGFSSIRKSYDLFAQPWEPCEPPAPGARAHRLGNSGASIPIRQ